MRAAALIQRDMRLREDLCQEMAVSQRSTETGISEAAGSSSEEAEEVVATVDDLTRMGSLSGLATKVLRFLLGCQIPILQAFSRQSIQTGETVDCLVDYMQSLKGFMNKVLKKYEECKIPIFMEACRQLKVLCKSCEQRDRLILAGSGNVGKSTIANALLGVDKFWPTAPFCMTSRICEAHYDAASDGKPVPKDLVHKSATSERAEFQRIQKPLEVRNPSPLLKPDVILVDLPGLDQEKEYMEKLDEYMKAHSADSVALFYVFDVKNKICTPDRQFFEKLINSPWQSLSQSLVLIVNKCDLGSTGNGVNSDEETPDYAKLISDITQEAQNYCSPKVMGISMTDKKKNHPIALSQWQQVEDHASFAVGQLKCNRLIKILRSLEKVMDELKSTMKNDQEKQDDLERRRVSLAEADAEMKRLERTKDEWVRKRAAEIRHTLKERQEEHLQALLRANVPNRRLGQAELKEFQCDVSNLILNMVANDIQRSAKSSESLNALVKGGLAVALVSSLAAGAEGTAVGSVALLAGVAFPALFVAGALAALAGGALIIISWLGTLADEEYVRRLFAQHYEHVIETYPSKAANAEYGFVLSQATEALAEQQSYIHRLQHELGQHQLDATFKAECAQLLEDFAILAEKCKKALVHWMNRATRARK